MEDLQIQMLRAGSDAGPPVVAASAPPQVSYNSFNPAISVVANFLARADSRKVFVDGSSRVDNRFNLRETEIDLRVPVDPFADAVLTMSIESETPGEFEAGVEEGYINLKKLPFMTSPLGLKFQVGRFRPAVGKFNLLHTHDLPTSLRSLPTEEFLGHAGFIQQGVSADFFLPSPWSENTSLNARIQALGGGGIGVSPVSRNTLAYVGNLRWFQTLGDAQTADVGWSSYWHPGNDEGPIARLHAVDFSYRWKPLRQGSGDRTCWAANSCFPTAHQLRRTLLPRACTVRSAFLFSLNGSSTVESMWAFVGITPKRWPIQISSAAV